MHRADEAAVECEYTRRQQLLLLYYILLWMGYIMCNYNIVDTSNNLWFLWNSAKPVEKEFLRFKRSDIVTRYVTDTDARALLLSQGVNITSVGNCNDKANSQCTSLDGVTESALNSVIDLRVRSMCSVVVNGKKGLAKFGKHLNSGVFRWHSAMPPFDQKKISHGHGKKIGNMVWPSFVKAFVAIFLRDILVKKFCSRSKFINL